MNVAKHNPLPFTLSVEQGRGTRRARQNGTAWFSENSALHLLRKGISLLTTTPSAN